ncbi:hypothetical protein [Frigoriglobus tundricola]|uniref:hypothetical protein n=1 Tax=Frigoriglobus tundricola TaxID=2774151 RepID=UPI00148EEB98|nr:hypothetical protein [Frigoriglobus tundricola]
MTLTRAVATDLEKRVGSGPPRNGTSTVRPPVVCRTRSGTIRTEQLGLEEAGALIGPVGAGHNPEPNAKRLVRAGAAPKTGGS